jgi:TldD protein
MSLSLHDLTATFAIDESLVRRVLAEAMDRGADFADLYFEHAQSNSISTEDGIISRASTSVDRGVGIRAVVGDQTGYAYSEDLELEAMLRAARVAAAIARGGKGVAPQDLRVREVGDHYPIERSWDLVGVAEKLPLLLKVEATTRALDESIDKVSVGWSDSEVQVLVATSHGDLYIDRRPMGILRLSVTAEKGGERQSNFASLAQRRDIGFFTDERIAELAREAVDRTMILFEAGRPPAGELPVVLAAGASGILLHEAIGHGLEADFNRKGVSIYADMMNQKVAPDFVTVVDDGTLMHERGSINVDDEGEPSERTVLIEDGVLRSYLHDRISALHYGVSTTGSGRRESFRHMPMPRMRCTFMEGGPHSRDEIIASVKKGIVAETFLNGQVQIGAGDFTFYIKNGWLIEDGRITAPIKDVNIIGNGPEALRNMTMAADDARLDSGGWTCGKDGQSVPVSQGIPTMLVGSLTVGGTDVAG